MFFGLRLAAGFPIVLPCQRSVLNILAIKGRESSLVAGLLSSKTGA